MHVPQLFNALFGFVFKKIVVPHLPERALWLPLRNGKLERMHRVGDCPCLWFANEKVNVFRHHDISGNNESVAQADSLEHVLK